MPWNSNWSDFHIFFCCSILGWVSPLWRKMCSGSCPERNCALMPYTFITDKVMLCIPLTLPFIPLGFTRLLTKICSLQGDKKSQRNSERQKKISWEVQANHRTSEEINKRDNLESNCFDWLRYLEVISFMYCSVNF